MLAQDDAGLKAGELKNWPVLNLKIDRLQDDGATEQFSNSQESSSFGSARGKPTGLLCYLRIC